MSDPIYFGIEIQIRKISSSPFNYIVDKNVGVSIRNLSLLSRLEVGGG
jgi:hypothetical protein